MNIHPRSTKIRWPNEVKNKAKELRANNYSYTDISKKLGIAKSTLHLWIKGVNYDKEKLNFNKKLHLEKIRPLAISAIKKKRKQRRNKIYEQVQRDVDKILLFDNKDYLKSLLAMLYWAEGNKSRGTLGFANTDPMLALLYITLLRKCFHINEEKIRIRLHLHYYHPIKQTRKYWSDLLDVPINRFGKIYIKKRSVSKRFRKNFVGICFIRYHDENLRLEILKIAKAIAEKIVPIAQLD